MKLLHCLVGSVFSALALASTASAFAEGIEDQFRASYHDAFKGKKVAYIPLSMGIDVAQGWGALWKRQADELGYQLVVRDPNWDTPVGAQALTPLIAAHGRRAVLRPLPTRISRNEETSPWNSRRTDSRRTFF
jgi:ABC-type sugar transport system substrate-binding protein